MTSLKTQKRRVDNAEREPTRAHCSLQHAAVVLGTAQHNVRRMVLRGELPGGWYRPPNGLNRRWWVSLAAVNKRRC